MLGAQRALEPRGRFKGLLGQGRNIEDWLVGIEWRGGWYGWVLVGTPWHPNHGRTELWKVGVSKGPCS